jgi:hypothetical protein
MLVPLLLILGMVGCGGDPNEKANELFVESMRLINSADNKTGDAAIADYEQALKIVQQIIDEYSKSDLAVRLVSGEKLFSNKNLNQIRARLGELYEEKQAKRERSGAEREYRDYCDYLDQSQRMLVDVGESRWASGESHLTSYGVKVRVPIRFRWIAPTTRRDRDGNEQPVPACEDKVRQPRFARNGLPGLLGSWYAVISDDKGTKRHGSSWMFLFGNYQRYKDRAAGINVEPKTFYDDLINELADAVGVAMPTEAEWQYVKFKKLGGYYIAPPGSSDSPDNYFTLIKLDAGEIQYRLYLAPGPRADVGDDAADVPPPDEELQFALLFVVPRNVTQPAQLELGIKYCLEWFEADMAVPSFDADGEGGRPRAGF